MLYDRIYIYIFYLGKRRVFNQHHKHQMQHANQHQNVNRKDKSSRKLYQKQLHPEYHFDGVNCTVERNQADGRKRVRCDIYEEWNMIHV